MKLGPFLGENNRRQPHALAVPDKGSFLSASNNVIIDDTGRIETRSGTTKVQSLTTGRSLFSSGDKVVYADGTSLYRVTDFSPFAASAFATVAAGRVGFADSNGEIFYTDGAKIGCLSAANAVRTVGIPVPASLSVAPTLGALDPAWYQVTITYMVGAEEGGAYPSQNIQLTSTGGIALTLPAAPAGVTAVLAYVSGPNGETPFLYNTYSPAITTLDIITLGTGRACATQFKAPTPAGEQLAFFQGRLLSASGDTLSYSDAYNYGLTTPSKNYIRFSKPISIVAPCVGGIYVAADKTYWITGLGTDDMTLIPVLPYGAVKYSQGKVRNEEKVFWLSERGVVIGDAAGQVRNVQEDAMLLSLSGEGASLMVEGVNRIVATNG